MQMRSRLAACAPVVIDGMRPWTPLKPCASFRKYVGVLPLHPIPEVLATSCGAISSSQKASMIAAVIESCPHPAHSVDIVPS